MAETMPPADRGELDPLPLDARPLVERHRWNSIKAKKPLSSSLTFLGSRDVLVDGWTHLLASHAKTGKTTLLLFLIREWYEALGSDCPEVLWISEEGEHVWDYRRKHHDFSMLPINVVYGLPHTADELIAEASEGKEQVVIVDTASALMEISNENDNSEVTRVLKRWINAFRTHSKTGFIVHHLRKSDGSFGTSIAGATAWQRLPDVVLEVREVDDHPERRVVIPRSRVNVPNTMMYEMVNRELVRMKMPDQRNHATHSYTDYNPGYGKPTLVPTPTEDN